MKTHLRIVIRQAAGAVSGGKTFALNDGVEVIDSETGEVVGDLSHYVRRIEVIDEVGEPRMLRLEMFAGEVAAETEPPRSHPPLRSTELEEVRRRTSRAELYDREKEER